MLSNELQALLHKEFKGEATVSKLSADLRGKVIVVYGGNNLGKTLQASRMKNPIFIPFEKGMNGVDGAMVLKTRSWSQARSHVKKLANKKFTKLLQQGEQITVVIDGIESMGRYCRKYIASIHDARDVKSANGGYGAWQSYEDEVWEWVDSIISLGYTVMFVGHQSYDKETDKMTIKGDARNIAPIKDNADIVVYLKSNGIDDEGKEVLSSGYLVETEDYFARSRFTYMDEVIPEYTAENLEKAIVEGIQREIEDKGLENVSFEEQQEIYEEDDRSIDELKEEIKDRYEQIEEMGEDRLDVYDEIIEKHLGESRVSEATNKQIESLRCILNDLDNYLEEIEEE